MATATLTPSAYTLSSTQYMLIEDASNMYADTTSDDFATITHNRGQNTSYYLYLHNFDFSTIPTGATVTSYTVKIKAREQDLSTSSSYRMSLYYKNGNSWTSISNTTVTSSLSTTATVFTFPTSTVSWSTISGHGNDFAIRVPLRRAATGTVGYAYVYGAEIDVTYSPPVQVTTTLTGSGTISPSGTTSVASGSDFTLTITPTNPATDTVTVKNNGTDVSHALVAHGAGSTVNTVLGEYTLVSGGFNGSGGSYFTGLVGKGHTNTQTTSNYYSSGSGVIAVFTYELQFTGIPSSAQIDEVYCMVNGHAESTSQSSEYMCAQLIVSGSVTDEEISDELNFKSVGTSNSTQTLEATHRIPTASELTSGALKLKCRLGYYGGAINGATCYAVWSDPTSGVQYYTYTAYNITTATTIAVTIGATSQPKLYLKIGGVWQPIKKLYVRSGSGIQGEWVEVVDKSNWKNYFDTSRKYVKGIQF